MTKKLNLRVLICALLVCLLCLQMSAFAAELPDLVGHWGEAAMRRGLDDGYISGFDDGTARPDSAVTTAQAITLLGRVLNAQESSDISALGLSGEEWYADAAGKALSLGIIGSESAGKLDSALTRESAFLMMAEAFQTANATEDTAILAEFSDGSALNPTSQNAIASLVRQGFIEGYNGSLKLNDSLTRAEFTSLLYRILDSGRISSSGTVSGFSGDTLWLDCSTHSINLSGITAKTVVIRSQSLDSIRISSSSIDKIVLAGVGDLTYPSNAAKNLQIGSGSGKITIRQALDSLEITGDNREISLSTNAKSITVTGCGNTIAVGANSTVETISLIGSGNTVTVSGRAKLINALGERSRVDGHGNIDSVYLRAPNCDITDKVKELTDATDYGLIGASLEAIHPELLPAGETLKVTVNLVNAPIGLENCIATWYIDGELIKSETVSTQGSDSFSIEHDYFYMRDMPLESKLTFSLSYTTDYGYESALSCDILQALQNYPDDYLFAMDVERVLALITSDYLGDYTLEWAEANDYEDFEKEIWVNAKGFESDTQYLIWINQSHQRVNIFERDEDGSWILFRECIVGCGARQNTPKGVFKTTWKQTGWFTGSYDCRPVVRFKGGGYAFHSRLYYPNSDTLLDPGIGYPISAGCIRMYDEDINWLYDNAPEGTTVVVH